MKVPQGPFEAIPKKNPSQGRPLRQALDKLSGVVVPSFGKEDSRPLYLGSTNASSQSGNG